MDSTVHQIYHYSVDYALYFVNTYPPDSDFSCEVIIRRISDCCYDSVTYDLMKLKLDCWSCKQGIGLFSSACDSDCQSCNQGMDIVIGSFASACDSDNVVFTRS